MDHRPNNNNRTNTAKRVSTTRNLRKTKPEWDENTKLPLRTANPKLKGLFSIVPPLNKGEQNSQSKSSLPVPTQRQSNNPGLKSPQKATTKRSSAKSPSSVRKNPVNATELTLARLKHEMEGLVGQLKIQKEESKELGYSDKTQNMRKLKEAHDHAVNTIMKYAQAAQMIVRQNNCSTTFRRELATLIQQLALYCAEIESDIQRWERLKAQVPIEDTSDLARMYIQHSLRKHELTKQTAPFSPAASEKFITKLKTKSPGLKSSVQPNKQPSAAKPTIAKRLFDTETTRPPPPVSNDNLAPRFTQNQTFQLDTIKTNLTAPSISSTIIHPEENGNAINAATLAKLRALTAFKKNGGTKVVVHPSTAFLRKHRLQATQHADKLVDYIIDYLCEDIVRELSEREELQQSVVSEQPPPQPLSKSTVGLQTDLQTMSTIATQITQNTTSRATHQEEPSVLFQKVDRREQMKQQKPSRNNDVEEYQRIQRNQTEMATRMKEDETRSQELTQIEEELRKIYEALTITETKWKHIDSNQSDIQPENTRTTNTAVLYNNHLNSSTVNNDNNSTANSTLPSLRTLPKTVTIGSEFNEEIEEIEWSEDEKDVLEEVLEEEYLERKQKEKLQYAEILTDYILNVALDSVLMEFWGACDDYVEDIIREEWGEIAQMQAPVSLETTPTQVQPTEERKTTETSTETADL